MGITTPAASNAASVMALGATPDTIDLIATLALPPPPNTGSPLRAARVRLSVADARIHKQYWHARHDPASKWRRSMCEARPAEEDRGRHHACR